MIDPLATLSRDALARLCYAANQPVSSIGLPFADLYQWRQDWWREVGDRLRAAVEAALREGEEAAMKEAMRTSEGTGE